MNGESSLRCWAARWRRGRSWRARPLVVRRVGALGCSLTVGASVRGSVRNASRICGDFLRALGALTSQPASDGPRLARALELSAGERCAPLVRPCAGRLGQAPPVPDRDSWSASHPAARKKGQARSSRSGPRVHPFAAPCKPANICTEEVMTEDASHRLTRVTPFVGGRDKTEPDPVHPLHVVCKFEPRVCRLLKRPFFGGVVSSGGAELIVRSHPTISVPTGFHLGPAYLSLLPHRDGEALMFVCTRACRDR
jgi:hypothetical protein